MATLSAKNPDKIPQAAQARFDSIMELNSSHSAKNTAITNMLSKREKSLLPRSAQRSFLPLVQGKPNTWAEHSLCAWHG